MKTARRHQSRLDDLLVAGARALGLHLTARQVAAFATYREEVTRWSARINLTALREPEDIVRTGFLESLTCLPLIPSEAKRAVDVGSGAGFPGLPLKLARPDLSFTLVEASRKKATFLQHMVRQLGMAGVRVVQRRAEELAADPEEAGAYDLALARAVAPPPDQGRLVRPFLRPGGLFLVQIGPGSLAPGALERLMGLGFEVVQELVSAASLGRPGRRVLAVRRAG
ncbi:MAG: 16S rRNA (guanine(527)-N(7))-methyltransferase RsmG [Candidatus Methylomirabilales bacterium]